MKGFIEKKIDKNDFFINYLVNKRIKDSKIKKDFNY